MSLTIQSDESLVHLYVKGNEQALEALIRRHKSKVFTSIYMFVRDRYIAEDIFQETFIRVVNALRRADYAEEGKFLPWLMRISHNLCIDFYRRTRRSPMITTRDGFDLFEVLPLKDATPDKQVMRKQSHEQVRDLVEQLDPEQREVLILRHYAEMPFKDIARLTGTNINTCLGRMRYALINLRKMKAAQKVAL